MSCVLNFVAPGCFGSETAYLYSFFGKQFLKWKHEYALHVIKLQQIFLLFDLFTCSNCWAFQFESSFSSLSLSNWNSLSNVMPLSARWKFFSLLRVLHGNGYPVILLNRSQTCASSPLIETQFLAQVCTLWAFCTPKNSSSPSVNCHRSFQLNKVYLGPTSVQLFVNELDSETEHTCIACRWCKRR